VLNQANPAWHRPDAPSPLGRIDHHAPPPRKLRPFRPSALSLETICPVSSLAMSIPPTASAVTPDAGTPSIRPPATVPAAAVAKTPFRPMAPRTAEAHPSRAATPATPSIAMPQAPPAAPTRTVDINRYDNTITIASANVPPSRPSSSPIAAPIAGGAGASTPAPATAQPSSTLAPAPSAAASPAPVALPASIDPTASRPAGIRPMTHPATREFQGASAATYAASSSGMSASGSSPDSSTGSGSGSSSCSTSTSNGTVPPPGISAFFNGTYASLIDPNVPGAYTLGKVPIGASLTISVGSDQQIVPSSIRWSGGTDIAGYLDAAPTDTPAPTNMVQHGVATNGFSYPFFLDATPGDHTVTVKVNYAEPCGPGIAAPAATLTYTSVAPTVSFDTKIGMPYADTSPDGTVGQVGLYTGGGVPVGAGTTATAGITITATTTASTFGGQFEFLQTIVPQRFGRDDLNQPIYIPLMGAGPAIDNGWGGKIGYPIVKAHIDPVTNTPEDNHAWSLRPGDSFAAVLVDSPFATVPSNFKSVQAGNFDTGTPESFDTYVLYHPTGNGTWVGLGKVHWAWSGKTNDFMKVDQIPNVPAPSPTVPLAGDAAFPGWTDTVIAFLARASQPYNGKF